MKKRDVTEESIDSFMNIILYMINQLKSTIEFIKEEWNKAF